MPFITSSDKNRQIDPLQFSSDNKIGKGLGISTDEGFRQRFHCHDIDDTGTGIVYYGFVNRLGYWFIMRETTVGTVTSYRFTTLFKNDTDPYNTGWGNRSTLTYDYIYNVI